VANTVWFEDSTITLDSLELTGGAASLFSLFTGEGLLVRRSTVNMVDCRVQSNAALYGGGLFVGIMATANVERTEFQDNTSSTNFSDKGGGIGTEESSAILDNLAETNGGGVATFEGTSFVMQPVSGQPGYTPENQWASLLQGNTSSNYGGAIFSLKTDTVELNQTVIFDNWAVRSPVGLYQAEVASLSDCVLAGNISAQGYNVIDFGGGTGRCPY